MATKKTEEAGTPGVLDETIAPEGDPDLGFADLESVPADYIEHANVDYKALAKLREEFPENQVGLLPKPIKKTEQGDPKFSCKAGTQASADGKFCGGYHVRSVHLDYVGHAAATNRMLDADPNWTWAPFALDQFGLPLFDKGGGLWINLTIGGVTRPGYGDSQGKSGANAIKEAIGDALRNGGMRFGIALNLWHKGDLFDNAVEQGKVAAETGPAATRQRAQRPPAAPASPPAEQPAAEMPQGGPTPATQPQSGPPVEAPSPKEEGQPPMGWENDLKFCKSVADMGALYKRAEAEGWWTPRVHEAFTKRRGEIENAAKGDAAATVNGAFRHPESTMPEDQPI